MLDASSVDLVGLLARQPLFRSIEHDHLLRLARESHLSHRLRGEIVCRQGEPCDALHVVLSGKVKLFAVSRSGHEKVVEIVEQGSSFGEPFLFQPEGCLWSSQVLTDSLLASVPRQAVIDEVQRDGNFAVRMLSALSRRLHRAAHDLQAQTLQSGTQRVASYLLHRADEGCADVDADGRTLTLPVSKATIASLLSITPEYFSRVLSELEQAGLIKVDRRDITIVDADALAVCQG